MLRGVAESQASESEIDRGKRKKCERERCAEKGDREERNKSDGQTKEPAYPRRIACIGGIMLLGNSAQRETDLYEAIRVGVMQRPGFHYHQMGLSPLDGVWN